MDPPAYVPRYLVVASDNHGPVGKCAAELWLSGYGLRVITVISPSLKFSTRELFDLYKTRMQASMLRNQWLRWESIVDISFSIP